MKHHLRLISLLLAALLLHVPALAAPGAAESLGLAQQYLRQELGLEPEAYALVREHHDTEHGYRTYFFELKDKGDTDGQIFLQLDPQGRISDFRAPDPAWWRPLTMALQEAERALPYGSSAEDMAALRQRLQPELPHIGQLLAAQTPEAIRMGRLYAFGWMLTQPLMAPPEGALTEEEALRLAGEAVRSLPLWDEETFSLYPHFITACYQSEAYKRPLYMVVFRQRPIPGESEIDHYMRSYVGKLDAHFGGREFAAPKHVSVLLDAMTGQLVDAPLEVRSGPDYRTPYQLFR